MPQNALHSISAILQKIKGKITDHSDVIYAGFDSPKKLRDEIDRDLIEFQNGKTEILEKYRLWFAATGPLQELSLSNGWGKDYLIFAEEFDKLYKKVKV
jgi:hypothetical protein